MQQAGPATIVVTVNDQLYGRVHEQTSEQEKAAVIPWPEQIKPTTQEAAASKIESNLSQTMLLAPRKGIQQMISTGTVRNKFLFLTNTIIRSALDPNPPDAWKVDNALDRSTMGSQVDLHAWGGEYRAECTILPRHWIMVPMAEAKRQYFSSEKRTLRITHLGQIFEIQLFPKHIWQSMQ